MFKIWLLIVAIQGVASINLNHFSKARHSDEAFLSALKVLDSSRNFDTCYNLYQPFYIHPIIDQYMIEYRSEFLKVADKIKTKFRIKSWDQKTKTDVNTPDEVVKHSIGKVTKIQTWDCTGENDGAHIRDGNDIREVDVSLASDTHVMLNPAKSYIRVKSGVCDEYSSSMNYFIRFDPITKPSCTKKARMSINFKDTDTKRPGHIFKLLTKLLFNSDLAPLITFAKVETLAQRLDPILIQVCTEGNGDFFSKFNKFSSDLDEYKDVILRQGPSLQQWHGRVFIADYTVGTSWGTDLCCLWTQVGTDWMKAITKISRNSEMPDLTLVVDTKTKDCDLKFDKNKLSSVKDVTSIKLSDLI